MLFVLIPQPSRLSFLEIRGGVIGIYDGQILSLLLFLDDGQILSLLLFLEGLDFSCQTHVHELTSNSSLTSGLVIYDFGDQN